VPSSTKTKHETAAERNDRLARERGKIRAEQQTPKSAVAPNPPPKPAVSHADEWRKEYGPNPFKHAGFVTELKRPDSRLFYAEDGQPPAAPLLATLPSCEQFSAMRQSARVSTETVAEVLQITAPMVDQYEAGGEGVFVLQHVDPESLRRLASALAILHDPPEPVPTPTVPERPDAELLLRDQYPAMLSALGVSAQEPGNLVRALAVVARGEVLGPTFAAVPSPAQLETIFKGVRTHGITPDWLARLFGVPSLRRLWEPGGGIYIEPEFGGVAGLLRVLAVLTILKESA
jgi:transcriptional regulator with XRE-family HTH domain